MIPKDWEIKKIRDIGSLKSGSTPFRGNYLEYFFNGNIPWVKTTDLNNSSIYETEESITELAIKETSCKILSKETILVAMYGGFNQIGRTGILKIDAAINQALTGIVVNKKIALPKFVLNWINYRIKYWKKFAASSRKDPNITKKDVSDFPIILPSILEQGKIIKILSIWDKAIEQTENLIAVKEKLKKGLMNQLLTGKKRLKGFKEKSKMHSLKSYIREISIRNKTNDVKRVLSVTNSRGFILQSDHFDKVVASENTSNYKIVRKGQFAYNPSRVNVGSLDKLENFEDGILSPMYVVFETKKDTLLPEFLYFHLNSNWFTGHISAYVQGSVRDSLSFDALSEMKFFIPDIKEQKAISEIFLKLNQEINLLKEQLNKLKQQKKGLMQILLTGKVRVKT